MGMKPMATTSAQKGRSPNVRVVGPVLFAATTIAAAMFFGSGLAQATPADGCHGNSYFDRNTWHCEPINTPSPPPPPPGNFSQCRGINPAFCRGLWN